MFHLAVAKVDEGRKIARPATMHDNSVSPGTYAKKNEAGSITFG